MFKEAKEFYQTSTFLNLSDISGLVKITSVKRCKAGDVLAYAGDVNHNLFIVLKGMLRNHIVKTNGEERTMLLSSEGMISGSPKTTFYGMA